MTAEIHEVRSPADRARALKATLASTYTEVDRAPVNWLALLDSLCDDVLALADALFPEEVPDTKLYTEAELFVAGAISTMPPFDSHHPAYCLPIARGALEALGMLEPSDGGGGVPSG